MKIYSIFSSINGEANCRGQGSWVTFIRTAGCSLGCSYCDTKYAQGEKSGEEMDALDVAKMMGEEKIPYIMITGGEPFEQPDLPRLIVLLKQRGLQVTIETNGAHTLPKREEYEVDCYVVDYKLPSAEVGDCFKWENVAKLTIYDFIKFVISNRDDYNMAVLQYNRMKRRNGMPRYAFSPNLSTLEVNTLYGWMKDDNIWDVQLSIQLHKVVRLSEPR